MNNLLSIYWNKNWSFQIVNMEGATYIEAKGLDALIRKPLKANKRKVTETDNLVHGEDKNRTPLFNFWKSKNIHSFN